MADVKENPVKVLVVDDSAFMRKVISDILNTDAGIQVIDTARNGVEALDKVKQLQPDVVTLDVEMPLMDGITCLQELLKIRRIPVIMLSSLTTEGADATIRALEYGAVDFITKPTNIFQMGGDDKKLEIIEKVKVAKGSAVSKQIYPAIPPRPRSGTEKKALPPKNTQIRKYVAIGTSTGGPRALQDVIPKIPGDIPAAFLIVQHMPAGFTRSLAERLNNLSELTVKEAEHGEDVKAGHAYIAPGDFHMLVEGYGGDKLKICLSKEPPVGGHRPSVNVMMNSLSDTGYKNVMGVIMTGMGGDGSEGIKKLKKINEGSIIAQDEKSCVVYGMPRVAVQTGVVDTVVPLKDISSEIIKLVGGSK